MGKVVVQDILDIIGIGNLLLCYVTEGFIKVGMKTTIKNLKFSIAMIESKNERREIAEEKEMCTIKLILDGASLLDIFFGRGEKIIKEINKGTVLEFS